MKEKPIIFIDTETCGFHGVPVLIQYAIENGPVQLHSIWTEPAWLTIELIEMFCDSRLVFFNAAFDWFHLNKIYNMLILMDRTEEPQDYIDELGLLESEARDGVCLKPRDILDLMLHARKTEYQSTMARKPIKIKKVPTVLALPLQQKLTELIEVPDIYFARRADKNAEKWRIEELDEPNPDFRNIVMRFNPSSALKALAVDALGYDASDTLIYSDVSLPKKMNPVEYGWAPFAKAGVWVEHVGKKHLRPTGPDDWRGTWPEKIHHHISHWAYNRLARKYAELDVIYTRDLFHYFEEPEFSDDDSVLACMVGATRWKGFKINTEKASQLREKEILKSKKAPTAPAPALKYLEEVMSDAQKMILDGSTKKVLLKEICNWEDEASDRAKQILESRSATKRVELIDKLLQAGRFHASFKVIGTLSSRMSGADKLNPQGIEGLEGIREIFEMAFEGEKLDSGDFEAFEVSIAEAVYKDPKLRKDMFNGKKIHTLFAQALFDISYDEIMATKGTEDDKYVQGKSGVFSQIFGGNAYTLRTRLGVSEEVAEKAEQNWAKRYPTLAKERQKTFDKFQSMKQPKGIGTQVEWHEPAEYVESMFGFRRYFTLENRICKTLYDLAQKPPKEWVDLKIKVQRRDRIQTATGAVQSALYAAAFQIQSANMRAACNHEIQSPGATLTKRLQCELWKLQEIGVHDWVIRLINVHDEVQAVNLFLNLKPIIYEFIKKHKNIIPFLKMDWKEGLKSWADK